MSSNPESSSMTPASLSRRRFLQQTTLAGASAALALPHLRGQAAAVGEGSGEGIRVGVIGVGGQGRSHLDAPTMAKNIVAICDVDRSHLAEMKAFVERKSGRTPATYGDYRRLLESKEVDAVVIATPDHWHALTTIHACEAGKDVYVEKPLTLTVHEGWAMIKAARRTNRIVQTGSQQRSWVVGRASRKPATVRCRAAARGFRTGGGSRCRRQFPAGSVRTTP